MYNLCVDACHPSGFIPKITFTSHRIESILDMIVSGHCIGLLMNCHVVIPESTQPYPKRSWITVDITPDISSQISLCYLANAHLSGAARRFIDFIQNMPYGKDTQPEKAGGRFPLKDIQ